MDYEERAQVLRDLKTTDLIKDIHKAESDLETAMREETNLRNLNAGYLGSYGSDCREVKLIEAELKLNIPEVIARKQIGDDGEPVKEVPHKLTAPEKEAWLDLQRKKNDRFIKAIQVQDSTCFQLENARTKAEMAKKRLDSLQYVLQLKIAQIQFLTKGE